MRVWIHDGKRHERVASGYGQLANALMHGLTATGHEARYEEWPAAEVCLFVCPPSSIRAKPSVPCAAFTMHETTELPPSKEEWPGILNGMDMVITPTSWNRRIWMNHGVSVPIEVVPLGVDSDMYSPPVGRVCTFLTLHENLGSPSSRENWAETLKAFWSTFDHRDRVRLVIKTWRWKPAEWENATERVAADLGTTVDSLPPITVIDDELTPLEMRSLYQEASLFVKHANREGWSLPCSEAVACGTQVAASEIQPLLSHLPADTEWFEPGNAGELGFVLRHAYRRFVAQEKVTARYTWTNTAAVLASKLRPLAEKASIG